MAALLPRAAPAMRAGCVLRLPPAKLQRKRPIAAWWRGCAATSVASPGSAAVDAADASTKSDLASVSGTTDVAVPSQSSSARDLVFKGPIADDVEGGGSRYASSVSTMWSNVLPHVRASFTTPTSLAEAPKPAAPLLMDTLVSQTKALAATTGLAPAHWSPAPAPYYDGKVELAPYRKGQTAAYHWPKVLLPREIAYRFPLDMYVDPVFQTGDPYQRIRMRGFTLFPRLQKKTTLLFIFSGQPLSGLWTGLRRWLDEVGDEFTAHKDTQVFRLHYEEGWWNRRTHVLTKFHLRRQVSEDDIWSTFVYRGKWKWEYVRALHLYDKELPVVLLIDPLGYIRWHAIGLPTDEATAVFRSLSKRLATERRNFT